MKTNQARRISVQAFDTLFKAVEAGKSETLVEYLKAMGRFHNYSLANAMLIQYQKSKATRVAGYRNWQKLGRFVKKGEQGIAIMAPIIWRKRNKEENTDEEKILAFKTAYVFDFSQTDGQPLPEFAQVGGEPGEYTKRLKSFIAKRGIELKYSDVIGSVQGLSGGGTIVIKANLQPAEEFSVIVHELSHEILHHSREAVPASKTVREVEAEATAYVVC